MLQRAPMAAAAGGVARPATWTCRAAGCCPTPCPRRSLPPWRAANRGAAETSFVGVSCSPDRPVPRDARMATASQRAQALLDLEKALRRRGQGDGGFSRGSADCRGQGASRGSGTPCAGRLGRSSAKAIGRASRQSRSDSEGAGSVPASAKTKFGIFGQCEIATFSDGGCNRHCCGSVGVAGRSGVAGTTWTM